VPEHVLPDPPYAATVGLLLLDRDQMDGEPYPGDLGQDRSVEGKLIDVSVTPCVGLEPGQIVAGLQINDPLLRMEPVDPDLTGDASVLLPCHPLGDSLLQERDSRLMASDACGQLLDERGLLIGEDRFPLPSSPFLIGLRAWSVDLAGLLVDGPADGIGHRERLRPLQNRGMSGPTNQVGRSVFVRDQTEFSPPVEKRASPELGELMAGKELPCPFVIDPLRLTGEEGGIRSPSLLMLCSRHDAPFPI
jgi:hypothetical protein